MQWYNLQARDETGLEHPLGLEDARIVSKPDFHSLREISKSFCTPQLMNVTGMPSNQDCAQCFNSFLPSISADRAPKCSCELVKHGLLFLILHDLVRL
jgi:hypothetical protein